ncbi:hypothetical protein ACFYNM_22220 [Streptomyces spororaveus]|uniref:hypothetical protein n=1 Tax=Streptomyces spororaveus TaxID=284039 RepID=UPI00369746A6
MELVPVDKSRLAKTGQEFLDLVASDADWIVRSKDDLVLLREKEDDGPLAKLPEPDFVAFANSLKFAGGGVVTGYYKALMPSLTLTEIHQVFERFGMSPEYFIDVLEAKCEGGDWSFDFWSFCASTCKHVKKA